MVVRLVTHIANITIATGSNNNVVHPVPDKFIADINPTRAVCAVDNINNNIGAAAIKPIPAAKADILPTIILLKIVYFPIIIYYDGYHFWNHYHFSFKKWEQVIKMSHRLKKNI